MNPFDLKAALLARHAQHVVLIHFPIALFMVSVAFDFAAQWKRNATLAAAAYLNLAVAAVAAIPVVISGLAAWRWQLEGQRLKGTLLLHLNSGIASTVLIWLTWWLHFRARKGEQPLPNYRLVLEGITVLAIALTAHLGGFVSGVNT